MFHHNLTQGFRNNSFIRMESPQGSNSKHPIYCRKVNAWYLITQNSWSTNELD